MTYRAYLRTFDGQVSEKTITKDPAAAAEAFAALVERTDLDGQKMAAALTYKNVQLAFHRFDRHPGDIDYWRDKLDEITWPTGQVGRPSEMESGRKVNSYLDADSIAIATRLGNGNLSKGIRLALKSVSADLAGD